MDIITYILMKQKMKKSKGGSITNVTVTSMSDNNDIDTITTVEKEED